MINSKINAKVKQIAGINDPGGLMQVALDEVYGIGWGGGIHFDIGFGLIGIRLSGDYITLSPDKDKFQSYVQLIIPGLPVKFVDGGKVDMISGNANAKLVVLPLPVFKPYATGGVGLANVKATDVILSLSGTNLKPVSILKDQTVMTYNIGAGADIEMGGAAIFVELKINWLMIEEGTSTMIPIATAGITF
jgi:opacity protein-like surface antigen